MHPSYFSDYRIFKGHYLHCLLRAVRLACMLRRLPALYRTL